MGETCQDPIVMSDKARATLAALVEHHYADMRGVALKHIPKLIQILSPVNKDELTISFAEEMIGIPI